MVKKIETPIFLLLLQNLSFLELDFILAYLWSREIADPHYDAPNIPQSTLISQISVLTA